MGFSQIPQNLKEGGSRLMSLIPTHPWLQHSVECVHSHPWISLGVTIGAVSIWKYITRPRDLPPGPFNLPIVGAVDLFIGKPEVKLLAMRPVYGDVIYLKVFGNEMVILNSEDAIREAFKKRGEEFAYLNTSGFFTAVGPFPDVIFMAPYTAKLRTNKKFAVSALKYMGFGTAISEQKIHQALDKLEKLLLGREHQPFAPQEELKMFCASVVFSIIFNEDLPFNDPKLSNLATGANNWFRGLNEGILLHDFLLPGIRLVQALFCFQSVKKTRKATLALRDDLKVMIQEHRASFDSTETRDIIDFYLTHPDNLDDDDIAYNILSFIPDGIDTAGSLLSWVLFYITQHPEVLHKLQNQIDKLVGKKGILSLSDRPDLPYADAIVLETLRCADVFPISPARYMEKDLIFRGYRIPKGTQVLASLYSVHHDPDIFNKPEHFNPSRFINNEGSLNLDMANHVVAFSMGRRMCIAEQYIKAQFFLILVRLAAKFSITFDPDQSNHQTSNGDSFSVMNYPPYHRLCFSQR